MPVYREDPFQKIVNVGWPNKLFAIIEIDMEFTSEIFSNIRPSGPDINHPFPFAGFPPADRTMDPDSTVPPYVFPASNDMLGFYRGWGHRMACWTSPVVGGDLVHFIVSTGINLGKVVGTSAPGNIVTVRLQLGGGGMDSVTVRLYDHAKWKENLAGGDVDDIPKTSDHGPWVVHQDTEAGPIFSTFRAGPGGMVPGVAFADVTINKSTKTASIGPLS